MSTNRGTQPQYQKTKFSTQNAGLSTCGVKKAPGKSRCLYGSDLIRELTTSTHQLSASPRIFCVPTQQTGFFEWLSLLFPTSAGTTTWWWDNKKVVNKQHSHDIDQNLHPVNVVFQCTFVNLVFDDNIKFSVTHSPTSMNTQLVWKHVMTDLCQRSPVSRELSSGMYDTLQQSTKKSSIDEPLFQVG